jgi:type II secretory pathway pseudopilin PulG
VEIMVVVVIIGLLAAMAMPTFIRIQRRAQNSRFMNDLRIFAQAFETYAAEHGTWPPNVGPGVVPPGMSGAFRNADWTVTTAIGGEWNWDFNRLGVTAAISVSGATADDAQMTEVASKIDDGDLATGVFIKASSRYMYILEP